MKPLKSGLTFANWLLRIALSIYMAVVFVNILKNLNFSDKNFYIALAFTTFSVLLFIGGFLSRPTITIISGIVITGLSIYKIILLFSGTLNPQLATFMVIMSIAFYFTCNGNQ
jgi:hypothetical protein